MADDAQPDILAIFTEAAAHETPQQREEFLDEACGNDVVVRQRVETLLRAHFDVGNFLGGDARESGATLDQPINEKLGTQIGPYKLLQQIGEGGMGVVYMAEQKEPVKRRVALKIIKPGMDTRQVIARFEAERQALAMMDHPNIAKVLDAGATESGRPYFVMELVNGLPVTKYCDEQHMTPKERLELFVPICQAVQHAHQKGIIHRDLKPSNILVAMYDNNAVPKIIDFGVAKATSQTLTEKTMFTALGQVVGTLEYMSPEQAQRNQLDIDTRSDVYSLGVVLYELLTGETPFDRKRLRSAAFEEMLRIIREEEPSKPSTKISTSQSLSSIAANRRIEPTKLGNMIRGELDWIVLKAMEKERGRRYATASDFSADVERYLNHEPVEAGPPSRLYRLRKFAGRNQGIFTAIVAVVIALVAGSIGTAWQAIEANQARDRAVEAEKLALTRLDNEKIERQRAEEAEQVADAVNQFLQKDLLGQADPNSGLDRSVTLREVLDRASLQLDGNFKDQPLVEAALRNTIGDTYYSLGDPQTAEKHFRISRKRFANEFGEVSEQALECATKIVDCIREQGRYAEAENLYRELLVQQQESLGKQHIEAFKTMRRLGWTLSLQGKLQEAEAILRKTLEALQELFGSRYTESLKCDSDLGAVETQLGLLQAAEERFRRLVAIHREIDGESHPTTLVMMHNLALCLLRSRKNEEADELARRVLESRKNVLGLDHPATLSTMELLSNSAREMGRSEEAAKLANDTLEISKRELGNDHPFTIAQMANLAGNLVASRRSSEAEKLLRETLQRARKILGEVHVVTLRLLFNFGVNQSNQQKHQESAKWFREAYDAFRRARGLTHPGTQWAAIKLGEQLVYLKKYDEANSLFEQCEGLLAQGKINKIASQRLQFIYSRLAWALATSTNSEMLDPEKAVEFAHKAVAMNEHPNNWNNLGVALYRNGNFAESIEALHKGDPDREDRIHRPFLAMSLWRLGNREEALKYYGQYVTWFLSQPETADERFLVESEKLMQLEPAKRNQVALDYLNQAIVGSAQDPGLWRERGQIHARLNDHGNAIADFTESLRLSPNDPSVLCYRAQAFLANEEPSKAAADVRSALAVQPDFDVALDLQKRLPDEDRK